MSWSGLERRRFVRANFPCKIIVYAPQEHVISTHTENIGVGGVRVIIGENLKIHSVVGVEIFLTEEPIVCKGKVVWVVEKKIKSTEVLPLYDMGLEFMEIKEEDRLVIRNFVDSVLSKEEQ
jgi:c-di-GMP-binding flagellar brake protein YcgR